MLIDLNAGFTDGFKIVLFNIIVFVHLNIIVFVRTYIIVIERLCIIEFVQRE
jgi:hypothetical protein